GGIDRWAGPYVREIVGRTRNRRGRLQPALEHTQRVDIDRQSPTNLGHLGYHLHQRVPHVGPATPLQKKLNPVLTSQPAERGGPRFEAAHDLPRLLHRILKRPTAHYAVDQRKERWISHSAAIDDLALEERRVILPAGQLNAVMLGIERLHDGFAGPFAASRA